MKIEKIYIHHFVNGYGSVLELFASSANERVYNSSKSIDKYWSQAGKHLFSAVKTYGIEHEKRK